MKASLPLFIFSFFAITMSHSQVLECTHLMSVGSQPALSIVLPGVDAKLVDAAWREYMKPYGKVTKIKGSKENLVSQAMIPDISVDKRLNVYSQEEEVGDGVKLVVWFDPGTGFVSSGATPKEYVASVKFLKDFSHLVEIERISNDLEVQKKLLLKNESALTKLQRENENLHKIIEDSKKRIAEAEKDIEVNLQNQEVAQKEVGSQTTIVENVQKKLEEAKKQE